MFLCGVLFILFVHILFLVGGAFSSPRLALLSCDLVYRGWGVEGGGQAMRISRRFTFCLVHPKMAPFFRSAAKKS